MRKYLVTEDSLLLGECLRDGSLVLRWLEEFVLTFESIIELP